MDHTEPNHVKQFMETSLMIALKIYTRNLPRNLGFGILNVQNNQTWFWCFAVHVLIYMMMVMLLWMIILIQALMRWVYSTSTASAAVSGSISIISHDRNIITVYSPATTTTFNELRWHPTYFQQRKFYH